MSISELIIWIIGLYLCWVLISRTIKSVKENNYKRKNKKIAKERKKAMDKYYKQRDYIKSQEKLEDTNDIEVFDNTDEVDDTDLKNFIEEVNDAGFDIDEEDALEYISDGKSPEDYVTYMEDFYQGDDDTPDDDSDDNLKEKAEDYKNDMSSLGYDITDDEAKEMAEEGFDPEDYAEEYDEEDEDY